MTEIKVHKPVQRLCICNGDLCDSLPLAGKEVIERCYASHPQSDRPRRSGFMDEDEITRAVVEVHGKRWGKLICDGENYVEMRLIDQAKSWFVHNLVGDHIPTVEPFTEEEQKILSHLDHSGD